MDVANGILGAQLYTVRKFCQTLPDVAASLKKVRAIGYTAIQISGFGPVDPKEVAKIVEDLGLTVAATHCSWEEFLGSLDGLIERHRLWKCRHPAVGSLPGNYYTAGGEGIKQFLDELAPVAQKLAAAGMDFSYHNHNKELMRLGGKTWLETLYDQAPPARLKAEIDTYWIQAGGGDPAWWVRKQAGREPLLHLKDMVITAKKEVRFAPIGEGNLNWPAILEAARQGGVEYYLIEQDESYEADPFDCLATSYRYLTRMGLR
jgi:sugar phosphate isomerase/epimerase